MALMDGLSTWLRQIIAVVLLATLIDLLLPNRTMQRYVRLVAGLFILMTVATPIMQWMKGDFSSKLSESLHAIELKPQEASDELAMIKEEGAKLRERQKMQAANLAGAKLESAIRNEVEQTENRKVRKVDVLTKQEEDGGLTVSKVTILLEPKQEAEGSIHNTTPPTEIAPIADVDIHIEVDRWPSDDNSSPVSEIQTDEEADKGTQLRISALIAAKFNLAAQIVEVKQPVIDTENSN